MKKADKKNKKRIWPVFVCGALCLITVLLAVYFMLFYDRDAYERQREDEACADLFINEIMNRPAREDESTAPESDIQKEIHIFEEDFLGTHEKPGKENERKIVEAKNENGEIVMDAGEPDFSDDNYLVGADGTVYTPDFATGELMFVLEYEKLKIRRGVYGDGTWDAIKKNLDVWLLCPSSPYMVLGKTNMTIYGHNHLSQDLSFNNLKNAAVGDTFKLYSKDGVYLYEVTRVFSQYRNYATKEYCNNITLGPSYCHLVTCGRENFLINGESTRYKDFIVEGVLREVN